MTGHEILEGLSFVDERFIAEAETAVLGRNTPWMKWLSVAACLCILLVSAFAMGEFGSKGTMECIDEYEAAAPEAAIEEAVPAETNAAAPWQESAAEGATTEKGASIAAGELHQIPTATLRIISVEDDHWVAVVEEVSDEPTVLEVGMQVTVVIDTSRVPETSKEDKSMFGGILLPEEGLLAKIENGAYDADANILYVTGANLEEPTD